MGQKSNTHRGAPGSFAAYTAGFVLSVLLTVEAYLAVSRHLFSRHGLVAFIAALAVVQLLVQLIFFLHMGRRGTPRWNLVIFCFMLIVVSIVAVGSLWIMHNLDYNMMPRQTDQYLMGEEGISRNEAPHAETHHSDVLPTR